MNRQSYGLWQRRLRRLTTAEHGQVLPISAFIFVMLIGIFGLVIDTGQVLYSASELQSSTDAAAMAGAAGLPNSTTVATNVATYSASSGDDNSRSNLKNVTTTYSMKCLTTLKNQGMACSAPANANAVQVTETITVPVMFFGSLAGKSTTISRTATASMRGANPTPYNVAIVLDTTQSMNTNDSDSQCNTTRIACSLSGVQVLLNGLSPCAASQSTCGAVTSGNVTSPVDKVSLFVFPGVLSLTAALNDYNCSGINPLTLPYTYPIYPQYQIIPFQSDYKASDTATTLSTASNLVTAIGGKSLCPALQAPGGEGTYYAGVIYQAQAALVAAKTTGVQNVMIILSDGDASAKSTQMTSLNNNGTYPSVVDQCAQAVTAAQAATSAGTRVYTVAYGSTSSGCSTDTSGITPCQTMQNMASASQYFFSDYTAAQGDGSCVSGAQPTSNLNQIFTQIAGSLTASRLIPNNTT